MISIRPLNPVHVVRDPDPSIAHFTDLEWRSLIDLVRQYGFEPPDIQSYYPHSYNQPVEIDAEASQGLWAAISAVYNDEVVSPPHVEKLMSCAQIGAEHGGIEIRGEHEFS